MKCIISRLCTVGQKLLIFYLYYILSTACDEVMVMPQYAKKNPNQSVAPGSICISFICVW